ncbi:uncharacterized protein LOC114786202 isoform X3 [Denticeps clupeoides]|uniref:uncharacterized protein LOC114786202 isoform X3 n=1 Tax=Denticeps clupeoides TaxID=299321 RepID=UPI0010A46562|nr:uncharacterized protein LOC114786202 isoform X3 [Denticeps clupeoides]
MEYCFLSSSAFSFGRPILYAPEFVLLGSIETFHCEVLEFPPETNIHYEWYNKKNLMKPFSEYTSLTGEIASANVVINADHEGQIVCKASVHNNTEIAPTYSHSMNVTVIEPVEGAHIVTDPPHEKLYEGMALAMLCNTIKGTHIRYSWFVNGLQVPNQNKALTIHKTTLKDSGTYVCIANNKLNSTRTFVSNSSAQIIIIKEPVSLPEISYAVVKEPDGKYSAHITCNTSRGSLPITFKLLNHSDIIDTIVRGHLWTTFVVPITLEKEMGLIQCQADNGNMAAKSPVVALEVVPVGGAVTLTYDYDMTPTFQVIWLRMYCHVERGTFPLYHWFLNGTLLEDEGPVHMVTRPDDSVLLLVVTPITSGYFHCEATNSFDKTSSTPSKKFLITKEVLNRLSTEVMGVVFGCFLFLVVLVTGCCLIGLSHKQKTPQKLLITDTTEMSLVRTEHTDEVCRSVPFCALSISACVLPTHFSHLQDEKNYIEDMDVVTAANFNDSRQDVESIDDWPYSEEDFILSDMDEDEVPLSGS